MMDRERDFEKVMMILSLWWYTARLRYTAIISAAAVALRIVMRDTTVKKNKNEANKFVKISLRWYNIEKRYLRYFAADY